MHAIAVRQSFRTGFVQNSDINIAHTVLILPLKEKQRYNITHSSFISQLLMLLDHRCMIKVYNMGEEKIIF